MAVGASEFSASPMIPKSDTEIVVKTESAIQTVNC